MKHIYWLLIALCPYGSGAQPATGPTPLSVGDQVPDILFTNIINAKNTTAKLSGYKGKLLLLDFWATNCSACIHKFALLDSLQKRYSNDFGVLLICSSAADTKQKVLQLFNRIQLADNISLGLKVALDDTIANSLFPHIYVPHYAWLDSNLKLIAITGGEDVTAEKIEGLLAAKPVAFSNKADITGFNPGQPLFLNGNGGNGASVTGSSLLSAYVPGLPAGSYVSTDTAGHYTRIALTNQPVLELLMRAHDYFYDPKRFHFPPGEDDIKTQGKTEAWLVQHSYTYQLLTPPVTKRTALAYMQQDIRRYLGYSAVVKTIPTACYVLTADTALLKKHATRGGPAINNLTDPVKRLLQNRPVSDIAEFLDNRLLLPVVDESGYSQRVDITLSDKETKDTGSLQAALLRYGIRLTPASRMLNNFFIYHHLPN